MLRRLRRGVTLVEWLAALTVLGLLGALALHGILASVRCTERGILVTERDAQLAAALSTTRAMLAPLAPGDGDALLLADTAATFRWTMAAGVVCAVAPGTVVLTSGTRHDGLPLGASLGMPQPGDLLVVHDEGPTTAPGDDAWTRHVVSAAARPPGACGASLLLHPVLDAAFPAWRLDVAPDVLPSQAGEPARVLRPARLALYRSTADWALGYAEASGGSWPAIQPVAGPLDSAGAPGFRLAWLDSTWASMAPIPAAVHLHLQGPTRRAVRLAGRPRVLHDSTGQLLWLRSR